VLFGACDVVCLEAGSHVVADLELMYGRTDCYDGCCGVGARDAAFDDFDRVLATEHGDVAVVERDGVDFDESLVGFEVVGQRLLDQLDGFSIRCAAVDSVGGGQSHVCDLERGILLNVLIWLARERKCLEKRLEVKLKRSATVDT
jgi:hypothetical protein